MPGNAALTNLTQIIHGSAFTEAVPTAHGQDGRNTESPCEVFAPVTPRAPGSQPLTFYCKRRVPTLARQAALLLMSNQPLPRMPTWELSRCTGPPY